MTNVHVSWEYGSVYATRQAVERDASETVIYIAAGPYREDTVSISAMDAETLILELRGKLDELYAKEDAE